MTRAVHKHTYNLLAFSAICAYQSESINGHSTVYQLLEMYHIICQNVYEQLSIILIFCNEIFLSSVLFLPLK
jgi:hypothetical protein